MRSTTKRLGGRFAFKAVDISNFRAFEGANFELSSFNVLVGVNGSGKTSALRAMTLILDDIVRRIGPKPLPGEKPSHFDFREFSVINLIAAEVEAFEEVYELKRSWFRIDQSVREGRRFVRPNGADGPEASKTVGAADLAARYWGPLEEGDDSVVWPLLCFFPVERAVDEVPLKIKNREVYSRRSGYQRAFTAQRNFRSFFQWFREQEDAENEQRISDSTHRDKNLQAVREAIEILLPGYTNLRVTRKPRLRMLIDKGRVSLAIQQLSDGERGMLTLVADLAKRASLLNPHLDNPLTSPGCVLIDEIELHLHPQWQRHLAQRLPVIFPNVQFVVTTHSPIICGSVKTDHLLVLEENTIKPAKVYGWSVADILKRVFDISERPDDIRRRLLKLDKALDSGDLKQSEAILHQLISDLPADDPEIVRANVVIPFLKNVDGSDSESDK